ncbi:unnamed protein product [Moneuplotes crassus]|uniref:poly(ADP-ribose) glycohydrolase n=1 Tax=Euplotes crassus TaxID=5936 RepID=A0AAD1UCE3_EUPCR|nr:unnamed protein product [Moneuplotes crassus]
MEDIQMEEDARVFEFAEFCTIRDEHWVQFKEILQRIQEGTLEEIIDHFHELFYLAQKLIWYRNHKQRKLKGFLELKDFIINETGQEESFVEVMHFIAARALDVKDMFPEDKVRILSKNQQACENYTSVQISCAIAHGFFCLIPGQDKFLDLPFPMNFNMWHEDKSKLGLEKLKFYYNYFNSQCSMPEDERYISFERKFISELDYDNLENDVWSNSDTTLTSVFFDEKGRIEEDEGSLMVDFANKFIGGGCMNHGCVQEEILFLIYPELLMALILCPKMEKNEAIMIKGPKRYSNYTGYGFSTEYTGPFDDKQPLDSDSRIERVFTAIDAIYFGSTQHEYAQFGKKSILRELNKALIGFTKFSGEEDDDKMVLSTGNWGCGAFNGNCELKFLIQWIAASFHGRNMKYFTFGDEKCEFLGQIVKACKGKSIKEIYELLLGHSAYLKAHSKTKSWKPKKDLISKFITKIYYRRAF